MYVLNCVGVMSVIDVGGDGFVYLDDYVVVEMFVWCGELMICIVYVLGVWYVGWEFDDFVKWIVLIVFGDGDVFLCVSGVGE